MTENNQIVNGSYNLTIINQVDLSELRMVESELRILSNNLIHIINAATNINKEKKKMKYQNKRNERHYKRKSFSRCAK